MTRRLLLSALGCATFVLGGETEAVADEPITPVVELRHDLVLDVTATAALAATTIGFRLVRDDLEPSHCRICDGSAPGEVNAVDDWFRSALRRPDPAPANVVSYALAFGAAPVGAAALTALAAVADHRGGEALVDILAIAEGGFSAMLATEVLEAVTLRERPYVHALADPDERRRVIAETGAFHSFPAGHVVEAFGVAAASGVVASMRGYRLAPLVWFSGLVLGVATAYTRIAADRHYFTDVLAGAAIGTVIGGGVPLLFHRPRGAPRSLSFFAAPAPRGQVIGVGWLF
jgi:membrane-associated phospholipid phosphatase